MAQRQQLRTILKGLFDSNAHVYFQPPENTQMSYPCIRYRLMNIESMYADNRPYRLTREYQLTVIDRNPDSPLREAVIAGLGTLFQGRFERSFTAEGLNHYVFRIYY